MSARDLAPDSFKPLIVRALLLPIFLVIAFAGVMIWQVNRLISTQGWVAHSDEVISQANGLRFFYTEMESAVRGFLITADPTFRQPYDNARKMLGPASITLQELVSDNRPQQQKLRAVDDLRGRWVAYVENEITLRATNGAWQDAVKAGVGKKLMDQIRAQLREFIAIEQSLRDQRVKAAHDTVLISLWSTGLMVLVLGGGLALLSRRQLSDLADAYEEALKTARESAALLEERVAHRTAALAEANARLEEEMAHRQRASEEIELMNVRLRISNRELQDFASVASHDLQEPLRKVQAFGDRLKTRSAAELGPEGLDYIDRMLSASARMKTLINDLLTFARVTSRAQPFTPVDLQAVAEQVISDLETRIEQTSATVNIGPLPTIDADVTQMRQILQNLIGNALKFSKPAQAPVVDVHAQVLGQGERAVVNLTVRDNGIGFDEKYSDRIFTVFQRLHGRQEYEGTGIGLAVCRKIAERHGGSIVASSKPGEGATFTVTLPVHPPDAAAINAGERGPARGAA
jgi:signal transduction histidine kinase